MQKPDDYTAWEYYLTHYTRGSGTGSNRNLAAWGGAGMAGYGATCGIAISCALAIELAVPRSATNGQIQQAFRFYTEGEHPNAAVSNAEWFRTHAARTRAISQAEVQSFKPDSLQCHNVVNYWRTNDEYHVDLGITRDQARSEFCGRFVADMCYATMKLIGKYKTPALPAFAVPAESAVRTTCSVAGCHDSATTIPSGFLPRENCFACHK